MSLYTMNNEDFVFSVCLKLTKIENSSYELYNIIRDACDNKDQAERFIKIIHENIAKIHDLKVLAKCRLLKDTLLYKSIEDLEQRILHLEDQCHSIKVRLE